MKGTFRTLLRQFCSEGTILGLKYFYLYPDRTSRCFWFVFIACIIYFACTLTYLLYRRFEAMPTRITIENQFEPIARLPYPAITLCSPNQMTIKALAHFDETLVNGNRSIDLENALPQLLGFYHFVSLDMDMLQHLQSLITLNRYTVPEVMVLLAQRCDEFLKVCFFKRRRYERCRGLFRPILTKNGLCCIFNSMYHYQTNRRNERDTKYKPHPVDFSGLMDGLTVIVDFHPADAADGTLPFAGSTKIMYTDWTEFPADDESVLLAPNTESFHLIHATTTYCSPDVKELPASSRQCSFVDEKRLPFFWEYRNSDCDMLCLVHAVEKKCSCLLFYLPHLFTQRICEVTQINCITEARLFLNEYMANGACECPRDCDSRRYHVDVTVGNLEAAPYLYRKMYRGLQFNKSTSIMNFFFPKTVYEKQKQETVMSYTTLASNLGGVFGLCMGCSVISVLEIWFYYYMAARNYVRRRLRPRGPRSLRRDYYE